MQTIVSFLGYAGTDTLHNTISGCNYRAYRVDFCCTSICLMKTMQVLVCINLHLKMIHGAKAVALVSNVLTIFEKKATFLSLFHRYWPELKSISHIFNSIRNRRKNIFLPFGSSPQSTSVNRKLKHTSLYFNSRPRLYQH